jgi:hypothetical protein
MRMCRLQIAVDLDIHHSVLARANGWRTEQIAKGVVFAMMAAWVVTRMVMEVDKKL